VGGFLGEETTQIQRNMRGKERVGVPELVPLNEKSGVKYDNKIPIGKNRRLTAQGSY